MMTFIDLIPHCMMACHIEHDREVASLTTMDEEGRSFIMDDFYFKRMQALADMATRYREAIQAVRMLEDTERELDVCWPNLQELLSFLQVC